MSVNIGGVSTMIFSDLLLLSDLTMYNYVQQSSDTVQGGTTKMPYPFQPVQGTAKVTIEYEQWTNILVNTLWVRHGTDTVWTADELETLANQVSSWVDTEIKPLMSNTVSVRNIICRSWVNESAPQYVLAPTIVGGVVGEGLPTNSTFAIAFKTAQSGRNYQGRNYVVGLAVTQVTDNRVDITPALDWRDAYAALPTYLSVAGNGAYHVVVSFVEDYVRRTNGLITPVTTYTFTDRNLDSQRRRLNGRGT